MTSPAITVAPETHCKDAAALLVRHRISALPVVDGEGRLVGIVSEADLLQLETSPDPRSQATPLPPRSSPVPRRVDEVMTPDVYTIDEDTDLGVVGQRLLEANVKRLPVMRGDRLVGIVSRQDLIRVIARKDEDVEAAIAGTLREEGLRLTTLGVRVRDGVVELDADCDPQALRLAEILVRSVPGVLDVRIVAGRGVGGSNSHGAEATASGR
jgi:CBS domain-containing protein